MRRIHIEFLGRLVKVRFARTAEDPVRLWDVLSPGQVHGETGLGCCCARVLIPEKVLLVPDVQFHRVAVFADRHNAQEAHVGILPEPLRQLVSQVERRLPSCGAVPPATTLTQPPMP